MLSGDQRAIWCIVRILVYPSENKAKTESKAADSSLELAGMGDVAEREPPLRSC
jgi:hypothetical protein